MKEKSTRNIAIGKLTNVPNQIGSRQSHGGMGQVVVVMAVRGFEHEMDTITNTHTISTEVAPTATAVATELKTLLHIFFFQPSN